MVIAINTILDLKNMVIHCIPNIKPKKEMVKMNNGETNLRIRKLTPLEL